MTTKTEIQDVLLEFTRERFPVTAQWDDLLHASLIETSVIDSLGVLEIATFVEQRLGVTLTDEEMVADHFASISALADLIHSKLAA